MKLPFGIRLPGTAAELRASFAALLSLRWAASLMDRRWAAPLSGIALTMGLIVGVALGPGASLGLGGAGQILVQVIPGLADDDATVVDSADGLDSSAPSLSSPGGSSDLDVGGGGGSEQIAPSTSLAGAPAPAPAPVAREAPVEVEPSEPIPDEIADSVAYSGTVVQLNPAAESFSFSTDEPSLVSVHSEKLPAPGSALQVSARELFNGTFALEGKPDDFGENNSAELPGVVSFRDPGAGTYTVSSTGSSVLVHLPPGADPATVPPLGATVLATAAVQVLDSGERRRLRRDAKDATNGKRQRPECGAPKDPPDPPSASVVQEALEVEEPDTGATEMSAIVQGVCEETEELLLSADAIRESGKDLTVAAGGFELGEIEPGDIVNASVQIEPDGTYALNGLAGDTGEEEADDPLLAQGDQAEGAED